MKFEINCIFTLTDSDIWSSSSWTYTLPKNLSVCFSKSNIVLNTANIFPKTLSFVQQTVSCFVWCSPFSLSRRHEIIVLPHLPQPPSFRLFSPNWSLPQGCPFPYNNNSSLLLLSGDHLCLTRSCESGNIIFSCCSTSIEQDSLLLRFRQGCMHIISQRREIGLCLWRRPPKGVLYFARL